MKCYHRTKHADPILENGFRDAKGTYMLDEIFEDEFIEGVFLSDRPLEENTGATGFVVLEVEIPEELLKPYEWIEKGKPYREFCVRAEIVNQHGSVSIYEADFQGQSREFLLSLIARHKDLGHNEKASALREHLHFLERHELLGGE